jgi:4-carboxymuconolactone decarboxylase
MSNLTQRGMELFSEIRGAERAAEMRDAISGGGFGSAMMALAVDFVFESIWTRPGLDRQQRSLVTLGILIALRRTEGKRQLACIIGLGP